MADISVDTTDTSLETPKVLRKCLDLFFSPKHNHYTNHLDVNINEKYSNHPDIQYFKQLKTKNHYNYHKFKRTPQKSKPIDKLQRSEFDPYSRQGLLQRLATFTLLNWEIAGKSNPITELRCAQNGWKCMTVSINNNQKNHLVCTACKRLVTLVFNDFDTADYQELNIYLGQQYLKQIQTLAHDTSCSWRNFETPLEGVYYVNPYLDKSNQVLLANYLHCLKSLATSAFEFPTEPFNDSLHISTNPNIDEFTRISELWVLNRFFHDNKENHLVLLPWICVIAVYSWEIKLQGFGDELIMFLVCPQCNQRMFIHPIKNNIDTKHQAIDLAQDHKPWCIMKHTSYTNWAHYLYQLVLTSESQIGARGQDLEIDIHVPSHMTQDNKPPIDINQQLHKLKELREVYLPT